MPHWPKGNIQLWGRYQSLLPSAYPWKVPLKECHTDQFNSLCLCLSMLSITSQCFIRNTVTRKHANLVANSYILDVCFCRFLYLHFILFCIWKLENYLQTRSRNLSQSCTWLAVIFRTDNLKLRNIQQALTFLGVSFPLYSSWGCSF